MAREEYIRCIFKVKNTGAIILFHWVDNTKTELVFILRQKCLYHLPEQTTTKKKSLCCHGNASTASSNSLKNHNTEVSHEHFTHLDYMGFCKKLSALLKRSPNFCYTRITSVVIYY